MRNTDGPAIASGPVIPRRGAPPPDAAAAARMPSAKA